MSRHILFFHHPPAVNGTQTVSQCQQQQFTLMVIERILWSFPVPSQQRNVMCQILFLSGSPHITRFGSQCGIQVHGYDRAAQYLTDRVYPVKQHAHTQILRRFSYTEIISFGQKHRFARLRRKMLLVHIEAKAPLPADNQSHIIHPERLLQHRRKRSNLPFQTTNILATGQIPFETL